MSTDDNTTETAMPDLDALKALDGEQAAQMLRTLVRQMGAQRLDEERQWLRETAQSMKTEGGSDDMEPVDVWAILTKAMVEKAEQTTTEAKDNGQAAVVNLAQMAAAALYELAYPGTTPPTRKPVNVTTTGANDGIGQYL